MDIKINGMTLEGDFMDADFMERYENAARKMSAEANASKGKTGESFAQGMRQQCRLVDHFFDEVFGGGTAAKVFEGSANNLMTHLQAIADLTEWAQGEKKKANDFLNKYTQRQQAAARRQVVYIKGGK